MRKEYGKLEQEIRKTRDKQRSKKKKHEKRKLTTENDKKTTKNYRTHKTLKNEIMSNNEIISNRGGKKKKRRKNFENDRDKHFVVFLTVAIVSLKFFPPVFFVFVSFPLRKEVKEFELAYDQFLGV